MNNIISSILFTILLIIFGILPVPSIPIAIINYKINGFLLGYFSILIAGTISASIYYKFAEFYVRKIIKKKFKKQYLLLEKYSHLISRMEFIEFILLLSAGFIPNSIISVSSGLAKMNFRKFIISIIVVSIPQQFILLLAATQLDSLNKFFKDIGLSNFNSLLFAFSVVSFLSFIFLYLYKKIPILKNISKLDKYSKLDKKL